MRSSHGRCSRTVPTSSSRQRDLRAWGSSALQPPCRARWAATSGSIGVDTDWYEDLSHNLGTISPRAWRSHVLTSARKRYDLAVYEALQTVASGDRLPPVKAYDLRSGFVDISYEGGFLDDVRPLIEDQRRRIVSGQLRVPCLPSDHVEVARAHLEQIGVTLDDWLDQGCPPWRISPGAPFEQAR